MGKNAQVRREARNRAIQSKVDRDKKKPSPPIFQIGERLAWKGVWFKVSLINGPNDVRLKIDGYTASYLDRGGEREFYVKRAREDDKDSVGVDSKKLVNNSGGDRDKEASDKLEGVPGEDSEAGGNPEVVQPKRD